MENVREGSHVLTEKEKKAWINWMTGSAKYGVRPSAQTPLKEESKEAVKKQ